MDSITILWHMHQPFYYYEDKIYLPWVFLHAIKDYYDMPKIASKYNVKVSFNLTPSLLIQLENLEKDYFLELLRKKDINSNERGYLLNIIKSVYIETMVKPNLEFYKLFNKKYLTDEEFINLEVFYLLAWCGEYLKEQNFIKNYLQQKNFTYKEKVELIDYLLEFTKKIIPFYKNLQKKGKIKITTTPFSHPILPLLFDMKNAKKANINTTLPNIYFSLKDDAFMHIKKAKEIYKKHFDTYPNAFWPAEGSVSKEVFEAFYKENIQYTFSGDDVIHKLNKSHLKAYEYRGVNILFRDRYLSDLIGFEYKNFEVDDAINHFQREIKSRDGKVTIILDGENAWEYYKKPYEFLHKFYKMLESENTKFYNELDTDEKIKTAPLGSWINGDFNTWVGDEEKNRAWEVLFTAKKDIGEDEEFLYAEGSDWFWWYGMGHTSNQDDIYDLIFRNYLMRVYKKHNLQIPAILLNPINNPKSFIKVQKFLITPRIDGKTTFFEWIGAGEIVENFGSLAKTLPKIYYGIDEENLYLRIDDKKYKFENFQNVTNDITEAVGERKDILRFVLKGDNFEMILPSKIIKLDINEIYKNWFV